MTYTRHVQERAQERGIPQSVIDLVLTCGTVEPIGNGMDKAVLRRGDKEGATRQLHRKLQALDKASDVVVVLDGDRLVTTYRDLK